DTFSEQPAAGGRFPDRAVFAETRTDGSTDFSSGFGRRVNVSAPSDNIASLIHACQFLPCKAHDVIAVLNGGTSASAPLAAAAAAVVLQTARLTGHPLAPAGVRNLLEATGRGVPAPPQIDRALGVGPQIDV